MNIMLVWSRDRAQQCHTLLSSIFKFHLEKEYEIFVWHSYSNEKYKSGYEKLKTMWPSVNFVEKTNKTDLLNILSKSNAICLLADDNVFFSRPPENVCDKLDRLGIFSYRLGLNTIVQNYFIGSLQQPLKNPSPVGYNIIQWSWLKYPADQNYGYPLAFDGHVYRTKDILPLLRLVDCDKPNTIEGGLQNYKNKMPLCLSSFKHSVLVNVPISNMSGVTSSEGMSLEELNEMFLNGRIMYFDFTNNKVVGCHQYIPYKEMM